MLHPANAGFLHRCPLIELVVLFSPACGPFEYRTHHVIHEFLQAFILVRAACMVFARILVRGMERH